MSFLDKLGAAVDMLYNILNHIWNVDLMAMLQIGICRVLKVNTLKGTFLLLLKIPNFKLLFPFEPIPFLHSASATQHMIMRFCLNRKILHLYLKLLV